MRKQYKNFIIYFLVFILVSTITVLMRPNVQGVDTLWMYAHGKDMIEHGLVRNTDIFSIHDSFSFLYQKWLMCLLTYIIVNQFGWTGLTIATNCILLALLLSMHLLVVKFDRKHLLLNAIMIAICGLELGCYNQLQFRPHMIACLIFVYMFFNLEKYARGESVNGVVFHIKFVISSIILMWFHSTMWILYVIVFLPYVCNFKFVARFLSNINVYVKEKHYEIKPLCIIMIEMFAAGILNPYGLKQYKYMMTCITAVGSKYSLVEELQPIPLYSASLLILYCGIALFMFEHINQRLNEPIYLPSLYLVIGSVIMPFVSYRLVVYSCLFVSIAFIFQLSYIHNHHLHFTRALWVVIIFACFLVCGNAYNGKKISCLIYETPEDGIPVDALSTAIDNIYDRTGGNARIFSTTPHIGSYAIYKGLKPYHDCRQEVYDVNINKAYDVLEEELDIHQNGMFRGKSLNDGGLIAIQNEYHFDYYVLTGWYQGDIRVKEAFDEEGITCLYEGYFEDEPCVWVYSFSDSDPF